MTDEFDAREAELDEREAVLDTREETIERREQRTVEAEAAHAEMVQQRLEQLPAARAARAQAAEAAAVLAAGPQTIRFGGLAASALIDGEEQIEELAVDGLSTETIGVFTLVTGLPGELVALAEALAARKTEPARRAAVCVYRCLKQGVPWRLMKIAPA